MMKALSLTQPWATLVAIGAKKIETRSWPSRYSGPLAIQAAKGFPRDCMDLCRDEPFWSALNSAGILRPSDLPRGVVLCTVTLMGCRKTEDVIGQIDAREREFGDYSPGRWAWMFDLNGETFDPPIPARGSLGLWDWDRELNRAGGGPLV